MSTSTVSDRDPSRVHWFELFFDLVFVALVGQLAAVLHHDPNFTSLAIFLALFFAVWWSWVNLTSAVSVMPRLTQRGLAIVMLVAMVGVGLMAVAAPEATGERAWAFAAGNAVLRIVLLVLWMRESWRGGTASRVRVVVYNGGTAVLWLVSTVLPHPVNVLVWAVAIIVEVVLLATSSSEWARGALERIEFEYLGERFGLLVIIALGESVLQTVTALSGSWRWASAVTAAAGFLLLAIVAWSFFLYGVEVMRRGFGVLLGEEPMRSGPREFRDIIGFLPYLLVAGAMLISGALAVGVAHPHGVLPGAAAVGLGGGVGLFYLGNAIITLRFDGERGAVLRWAIPVVAASGLVVVLAFVVEARWAIPAALVAPAWMVVTAEVRRRRPAG